MTSTNLNINLATSLFTRSNVTPPSGLNNQENEVSETTSPKDSTRPNALSINNAISISPKRAFDTLKSLKIMESISGKSSDPRLKFNLVQSAAPQYFDNIAAELQSLPQSDFNNTPSSQKQARETFEKLSVFTWALQSSTTELAGSDKLSTRPLASNADLVVELITDINEAEKLFDQTKSINESNLAETSDAEAKTDNSFKPGESLETLLESLGDGAKDIIDMSNRNDNFALIGQASALFTYAQSLLDRNPELLGEDTEKEAQLILNRVFEDIRQSSTALVIVEQKYGTKLPPPLSINA